MRHTITILLTIMLVAGIVVLIGRLGITHNGPKNQTGTSTTQWQTYENERFSYRVDIPQSFTTSSTPQNNDGREFTGPSASTTVRIFGRHNTTGDTLRNIVGQRTSQMETMRNADVGSSTATLYGETDSRHTAVKILHTSSTVAIAEITYTADGLSDTARAHTLDSFRWIRSSTTSEAPDTSTPADQRPVSYTSESVADLITVQTPTRGQTVTSPLTVSGEARGQWFFEADAPVVLTDWDGRIIAEGYIQAEGEWMTEEFVPFSGTLEFDVPAGTGQQSVRGSLIIRRANPSGQSENDMAVEIPVQFSR